MSSPWDIINDLVSKNYNYNEDFKNQKIMVMKILAMSPKYIAIADALNQMRNLTDKMFYDFLFYALDKQHSVRIPWLKTKKKPEKKADKVYNANIEFISDYLKVNKNRAEEYYEIYESKI